MIQVSNFLITSTFILYVLSSFAFIISITGRNWNAEKKQTHRSRWGRIGFILTVTGLVLQLGFIVTRWIGAHYPIANMFEFMAFLSLTITIAFTIIYSIYRVAALGAFAMPLAVIVFAYAYVFPSNVQPLIPALQSNWLKIHVSTAALGEGLFAVGFAAGLMYLLKTVDTSVSSRSSRWLEFSLYVIIVLLGFIGSTFAFAGAGYEATFTEIDKKGQEVEVSYVLPPIVGPHDGKIVKMDSFLGMEQPLIEAPAWMKGKNSAKKLNTLVWSFIVGAVLYGLLRLILRKRIAAVASRWVADIDEEIIDEISYRAIAIGYPVFILGALVFAMIWAEQAWGRFWGWDPKEVWALIVFLFYTAYLHFRLSRGWQGSKSAWMAVLGFLVVMFTLVGVNLVLSGLHAYSGV